MRVKAIVEAEIPDQTPNRKISARINRFREEVKTGISFIQKEFSDLGQPTDLSPYNAAFGKLLDDLAELGEMTFPPSKNRLGPRLITEAKVKKLMAKYEFEESEAGEEDEAEMVEQTFSLEPADRVFISSWHRETENRSALAYVTVYYYGGERLYVEYQTDRVGSSDWMTLQELGHMLEGDYHRYVEF